MQRRTVVLVGSDSVMERAVQTIADSLHGADMVVAGDIDRAGVLIKDLSPALVVADDDAPAGAAQRLLESLKSEAETRDTPLVVLCTDGDTGRRLISGGAEAFLPKPFDVADLLAVVQFYAQAVPREMLSR